MKQNYFMYNGKQYNTGDKIVINFFDPIARNSYYTNVKFLYYDVETKEYCFEKYGKEFRYNEDIFLKSLYKDINPRAPAANNFNNKHTF